MRLPNLPRLAAQVIHAVAAEYKQLDRPAPARPRYAEQSCTGATTQVNTADPPKYYRDARVTRPYAHGIGFTGDPR